MKNRSQELTIYLVLACVVFFYLMIAAILFASTPTPVQVNTPVSPYIPILGLFLAVIVIGYLLGSLPFGLWLGMAFAGRDVRKVGSGKIGMTNVMRLGG